MAKGRISRRDLPGGEVHPRRANGRAVANSWLQMDWWEGFNGPDHWQWGPLPPVYDSEWRKSAYSVPVLAGVLWKLLVDAHDAAAARLPRDRWLEVRYEDVVESPDRAFTQIWNSQDWRRTPLSPNAGALPFGSDRTQAFRREPRRRDRRYAVTIAGEAPRGTPLHDLTRA